MNPCQICPRRKFLGGLAAVGGMWSGLLPSSGLSFGITTQSRLRNAAGAERIAISFMAKQSSYYAVRRGASPAGPFSPVPFALQRDGVLSPTQLIGDGTEKTVYVDAGGQRGFYVLELLIFEIS